MKSLAIFFLLCASAAAIGMDLLDQLTEVAVLRRPSSGTIIPAWYTAIVFKASFTADSTTNLYDESIFSNHGAAVTSETTPLWTNIDGYGCYRFGTNKQFRVPSSTSLQLGTNGTLSVWVWPGAYVAAAGLINKRESDIISGLEYGILTYEPDAGTNGVMLNNGNATSVSGNGKYPLGYGSWRHVVWSWNATQGTYYVDGILRYSTNMNLSAKASANAVYLGSRYNGAGFFSGFLDEPEIIKMSMNSSMVYELFLKGH